MTSLNEKQIVDIFVNNFRRSNRMIAGGFRSRRYYTAKPIGEDDVSIISPARSLSRGVKLIFKCDTLVESTDVPPGMKAWQIARKSIVSCVSDLAAKGIKPPYMSMISLGIPAGYSKDDLLELVKGFKKSSREFGIEFMGGDTNEASELIIGCALIGFSKSGNIPTRNGAKPGDYIIVSGTFGYPSAGLEILTRGAIAREMFRNRAISSVTSPKPQQKFGTLLARYLSSSIDSSDGLAISLYELASRSKVDFFVSITPMARGIMQFVTENKLLDFHELIFHGGEEFHIVATVSRQNLKRAENMARKQKLKLIVIGKATSGTGKVFITGKHKLKKELSLLDNRGYLHFQNKSKV
ncbi:MAG TPA: thiamine-phosphate kinase [Nitrososphaeraceae archaeon]|nr:thiamine-phosphate kinase [Nitrososphaeraceae archaeon]